MRTRNCLLATGFAVSLLAYPLTTAARVDIDVAIGPPPVVVEEAPRREGYLWAPGYWNWDNAHHRHVWKKGRYIRNRPGEHWVPHAWTERDGRYHFNEGHWEHGEHGS